MGPTTGPISLSLSLSHTHTPNRSKPLNAPRVRAALKQRALLRGSAAEYAELSRFVETVYTEVLARLVPEAPAGDAVERAEQLTADYLSSQGIKSYEFQRLGHGIGFENQEPPFLIRSEDTLVVKDMVFAVHPGVLARGVGQAATGGIVRVTEAGVRPLVEFNRSLREIGL